MPNDKNESRQSRRLNARHGKAGVNPAPGEIVLRLRGKTAYALQVLASVTPLSADEVALTLLEGCLENIEKAFTSAMNGNMAEALKKAHDVFNVK